MRVERLALPGLALLVACALFLCWGLSGRVWFILELRAVKLLALVVVGASVGVGTVLFQTVTGNRILTPGILGFDSLFLFLQTLLVMGLGGIGFAGLPATPKFLIEAALMMVAATALFGLLVLRGPRDLTRVLLIGVVLGALLRSLAALMQRLMDPSEFAMVQGAMFASFGSVDRASLAVTTALVVPMLALAFALAPRLDVMALGRTRAVALGLRFDLLTLGILALVAGLTAVGTALVGPISFLGLLVAALAHGVTGSHRHAALLPAAAMIGAGVLVIGQWLFERVLVQQSSLAVVIEFLGGLVFLALVIKGARR
ncbi:MAG: iron chelate uptake ABC transporter family permease subunit [Rubellimicrobium sp.]|nr:iron chelate uptake ABC transporter family permease subunit [Rubellimicrobium sp.]